MAGGLITALDESRIRLVATSFETFMCHDVVFFCHQSKGLLQHFAHRTRQAGERNSTQANDERRHALAQRWLLGRCPGQQA